MTIAPELDRRPRELGKLAGGITVTEVGLVLPAGLSSAAYQRIGADIARTLKGSAWAIGDWGHYGEWEYGKAYEAMIRVTGLDYQTLRNYASVAGRFSLERRRRALSFAHHAEVAALPIAEQDAWLDRAEQERWTRQDLRAALQEGRAIAPAAALLPVAFRIPPAKHERWAAAAARAGVTVSEWAEQTLDEAAANG